MLSGHEGKGEFGVRLWLTKRLFPLLLPPKEGAPLLKQEDMIKYLATSFEACQCGMVVGDSVGQHGSDFLLR